MHTSYSLLEYGVTRDQALQDVAAGEYDDEIAAAARATRTGDVLELVHEADKKVSDGDTTWATVLAAKNRFYRVVKRANPRVLVANTLTGYTAEPASGRRLDRWARIKADILGIDCDGINPRTGPYPDYSDEVQAAVAFVTDHADRGYRYWSVPEFTAGRQPGDVDGTKRAAWIADTAAEFVRAGASYVMYFDYDNVGIQQLTTPAEIATWRAIIAD